MIEGHKRTILFKVKISITFIAICKFKNIRDIFMIFDCTKIQVKFSILFKKLFFKNFGKFLVYLKLIRSFLKEFNNKKPNYSDSTRSYKILSTFSTVLDTFSKKLTSMICSI